MRHVWLGLVLAAISGIACTERPARPGAPASTPTFEAPAPLPSSQAASPAPLRAPVREGGTLARAATDDVLYLADEDHGVVRAIPLPVDVQAPAREVRVPGQPAQVLALGDRVLVTVRSENAPLPGTPEGEKGVSPQPYKGAEPMVPSATGPGLLLIFRPDPEKALVEVGRVELPQDAWGVAVNADETIAVVSSAWTHKVSAVDLRTGQRTWTVDVPREPRAVAIRPDGKAAYVTHLTGAALTRIDGLDGEPRVGAVDLPASPLRAPFGKKNGASLAYSATFSPDGKRLFVARHALGAEGPQAWFGAATVDVLRTADDSPLAPARSAAAPLAIETARYLIAEPFSGGRAPRRTAAPFAQPRAIAYRARSKTLLVVGEGDSRMVELDARAADPAMFVRAIHSLVQASEERIPVPRVCGAPSGIALSADEDTAYVFCRSTYDLLIWSFAWEGPRPTVHLADDLLPADAALGRRIYFDGTDTITSGGLGCAGCHPEGRDDGHVWHETRAVTFDQTATFVSGAENAPSTEPGAEGLARQTPMLAGRVFAEGPYGWHAESPTLAKRLMGGFELHRWDKSWAPRESKDIHDRAMALRAYLRRGLVPPPRPAEPPSELAERGKAVFESEETGCKTCHTPSMGFSDRETYALFSSLPPRPGFAEDPDKKFKTPSLLFVGGTAPYLHDGRFPTLRALVDGIGNGMGHTSHLSRRDKDALIAYLETL
jgi:hypothetical protein